MTLEAYRFPNRVGGNLCLDFTNTTEFRDSKRCLEFLSAYDHVLAWCGRNHQLDDAESQRLAAVAAANPTEAANAFSASIDLREALYRIFTAVIAEEPPVSADLQRLNDVLSGAQRHIEPSDDGFAWAWSHSDDLARILAPIALAAAELLTSDQLQRVRQCPNCGWLFVDTSRNHSRRWCSMDVCGSQVKSRRQYERRKTAKD